MAVSSLCAEGGSCAKPFLTKDLYIS